MRIAALVLLGGCILPVSTGAPLPATTVGQGQLGVSMSGEAPVLDLIASNDKANYTDSYGASPAAAATLTLSYGLSEHTDVELAAEGALYYYFLPLPTGVSIGLRHHLYESEAIDVAIAARFGGVSSGGTATDANGNASTDEASAYYGAFQGVLQKHSGVFRPLVSLNVMPFRITRAVEGSPIQRFNGEASSLTLAFLFAGDFVQAGPYITVTDFESQTFSGARFASGGVMLSFRRDRSRRVVEPPPPVPYPMTPAPPPGTFPQSPTQAPFEPPTPPQPPAPPPPA